MEYMTKDESIKLRLTTEQKSLLQEIANKENIPLAQVIRKLIKDGLAHRDCSQTPGREEIEAAQSLKNVLSKKDHLTYKDRQPKPNW